MVAAIVSAQPNQAPIQPTAIDLRSITASIASFVERGTLDGRVLSSLLVGDELLPKECELWDYKREAGSDAVSRAKIILRIVSFYNTYGGYLIYGVNEKVRDRCFVPEGIQPNELNLQQLRAELRNYTGCSIDISYSEVQTEIGKRVVLLGLLHIPKRLARQSPVQFGKDGPTEASGKPVFRKGTAYFRLQDNCLPADGTDHFKFLFGERDNPFLAADQLAALTSRAPVLDHNLPERALICPRFFGRGDVLDTLWRWLGDDFAPSKVLAGDGGKGKTSIAYEFAEDVCRHRPYGFERVIWLSAKSRRFLASQNRYVNLEEPHFTDLATLLRALATQLALLDAEITDATDVLLKRQLAQALKELPCLIVIDDVDSLETVDEQRLVHEAAGQIAAGTPSRILITTRMNVSYSNETCITVRGIEKADYSGFVDYLTEQLQGLKLAARARERLYKVSDGSPLFTESILRLCRSGMKLETALHKWRGKMGEEVRMAALGREVDKLSQEGKRVLLVCAMMREASSTELRQVTGYDESRLSQCVSELQALFLVAAPRFIGSEARFRVSENVARLVMETGPSFVRDPVALEKRVGALQNSRKRPEEKYAFVGAAIGQAMAMLKDHRHEDAIATIEAALGEKKDNPDLLFTLGRCLVADGSDVTPERNNRARKLFERAHQRGKRDDRLYEFWFLCEARALDWSGAAEIATRALSDCGDLRHPWLAKRARAVRERAEGLQRAGDLAEAATDLRAVVEDLKYASREAPTGDRRVLMESLRDAGDKLWSIVLPARDVSGWTLVLDIGRELTLAGDRPAENVARMVDALESLAAELLGREPNARQWNMVDQRTNEVRRLLASRDFEVPARSEERIAAVRRRLEETAR